MPDLSHLEPWQLIMIAVLGFVLGRVTAPDPWAREQARKDREAGLAKHRAMFMGGPAVEQARTLLRQGKKIQAIKLVREKTQLGLRDAKDLVESLEL